MPTTLFPSGRIELKYFIPSRQHEAIVSDLLAFMTFDPQLEETTLSYTVWSLYFDSPSLRGYFEKIDGLNIRHKLRLRTYGQLDLPPKHINIEVKSRVNIQSIKTRSTIPTSVYHRLLKNRYRWSMLLPFCSDIATRRFYQIARLTNVTPSVLVKYRRQALIAKHEPNVRVTFDWELQQTGGNDLFNPPKYMTPALPRNKLILELKFTDYMPDWMYFIIKKYRLFNEAISKYTICLSNTKNL